MEINLRCPADHQGRWILNDMVDSFDVFCSQCHKHYTVTLLPDGSYIMRDKIDHTKPWDGKDAPGLIEMKRGPSDR